MALGLFQIKTLECSFQIQLWELHSQFPYLNNIYAEIVLVTYDSANSHLYKSNNCQVESQGVI